MSAQKSLGVFVALLVFAGGCLKQPKIDAGSLKCKTDENCPSGYRCFGATSTVLGICARTALDGAVADAPVGGELGGAIDGTFADGVLGDVGGAVDGVPGTELGMDSTVDDGSVSVTDAAGGDDARAVDDAAKDAGGDVPITGNGGASGGGGMVGAGGIVGSGGTSTVGASGGAGGTSTAASTGGSGGVAPSGGTVGAGGIVSSGGVGGALGVGGVTSTGGTTPIADCGPLTKPDNGAVTYSATTAGSMAEYSCSQGFGPSGSSTRYCLSTGSWSGVAPSCVIANCPGLASPPNGLVSAPALTYNSTATYTCSSGYDMVGADKRTCQANGTWSGAAPTCPPVDCGTLTDPVNGKVNVTTTTYNSSATYSCTSGYSLSDTTPRTCQASKQWSGNAPTCPPVDCGSLSPPTNGKVNVTTTTYNSSATYSCDNGYNLSDTTPRTCQANKQWSGNVPTCTLAASYGDVCSATADCPSDATCCNGSVQSCDATRLPAGDGTNTGEFVVSSDGLTVTDTITGLVWQRDGLGPRAGCTGTSMPCTWAEATAYCAGLTLGGLTGWRLPARDELLTIVDFTNVSPAINLTVFPSTDSKSFWTSSLYAGSSAGSAWYVYFGDGSSIPQGVGAYERVRCVR